MWGIFLSEITLKNYRMHEVFVFFAVLRKYSKPPVSFPKNANFQIYHVDPTCSLRLFFYFYFYLFICLFIYIILYFILFYFLIFLFFIYLFIFFIFYFFLFIFLSLFIFLIFDSGIMPISQ